jgi:hypothetical protein
MRLTIAILILLILALAGLQASAQRVAPATNPLGARLEVPVTSLR